MSKLPKGTMTSRAKANTTKRQKIKTKWDKKCVYEAEDMPKQFELLGANFEADITSSETENWCRLLDEGVVVDNNMWTGEPEAYAVIRKGVIKAWYDNLPDNFVGTIDKDHNRSIDLGKFTKQDLRLVELGSGRYAVDVNVKLDHELYAVKDLIKMNNRTALSVEMFVNADEFAKASKVTGEEPDGYDYLVPLVDEIKIEGYAVCMAPKSANSYKDDLLINASIKEDDMNKVKKAENLEAEMEVKEVEETETADEQVEEVKETTEAETTETAETETETQEEQTEEKAEDTETTEETETKEEGEGEDKLDQLESAIADMKKSLEAKDAEIAELKAKLEVKEKTELSTEDRIAALLFSAKPSSATKAEGKSTTKNEESIVDVYRSAFMESN